MRLLGAIAAGETLETNELNDAFLVLNQMISSWNTEGLSLVGRNRQMVPLTLGQNSYSLAIRPIKIEAASAAISGIDSPIEIVDSVGWESVPEKAMTSVYIRKLFCDYLYPNSSISIWPTPRIAGTLEMVVYATITQFSAVTDTVDLPPGYEMAVRYNLAMALLPEYPRSQIDQSLPAQAQMYKASLAQLNASNHARSQTPSTVQAAATDAAEATAR